MCDCKKHEWKHAVISNCYDNVKHETVFFCNYCGDILKTKKSNRLFVEILRTMDKRWEGKTKPISAPVYFFVRACIRKIVRPYTKFSALGLHIIQTRNSYAVENNFGFWKRLFLIFSK